jgi:hypothetical protein
MLSARGEAVLVVGAVCWFAAVFFGSLALYPVAAGCGSRHGGRR